MTEVLHQQVKEEGDQMRLDRWFQHYYPHLSYTYLQKLIRTGQVRIDGKRAQANVHVLAHQTIRIPPLNMPEPQKEKKQNLSKKQILQIQESVIYKDQNIIAINKPQGLAVQGGSKTHYHIDLLSEALMFELSEKPKIVHRLDKDTSGVLLLARNLHTAQYLMKAFQNHTIKKTYLGIVVGHPKKDKGEICLPLLKKEGFHQEQMCVDPKGQKSITTYEVLDQANNLSLLAFYPQTGRTHQIRVHCAASGFPLLGDGKYGAKKAFITSYPTAKTLHLHAQNISMTDPAKHVINISAHLPKHMEKTMQDFKLKLPPSFVKGKKK